jgi:hypothetical protein
MPLLQFRIDKRSIILLIALTAGKLMAAIQVVNADNSWLPVTDAERAMKAPIVDPKAGVEAIFMRVHVSDDWSGDTPQRISVHYVRLKVFNEEGKDKASTIEIPFDEHSDIVSVAGRTTKPDGTVLELSKDAIHESVQTRLGGLRRNVKSFAMPGVDVGAIVEYRWREIRETRNIRYLRLQFQDEFPIEKVTYFVHPLRDTSEKMSFWPFNCKPTPLTDGNDGFDSTTLENIAAFREEPMMPGEPNVRPWALVFYHQDTKRDDPDKYWSEVGKRWYKELKTGLKANDELKQIAAQTVAGAKDDNEKATRLIQWIHANVRDLWGRQVSSEERAKVLKKWPKDHVRSSTDVYKSGVGTSDELNTLFAALAMHVGMDARPALMGDRDDMVFDKRLVEDYFLRNVDMALSIGGQWKIYDVNARMLPAGMLSWREEGVSALIADPKTPEFITVPISGPDDSMSNRKGRLALSEDGTLEGDLEESWTGHAAEERRRNLDGESSDRQQEDTKEQILKWFPQAEVTALHLENADKPDQALKLTYHIRVPGYATRTGKRILFQPVFFQRGEEPLFSTQDRKYDVIFHFPWRETDAVSIELPAGFTLEKPENPGNLNFGAPGGYSLAMTVPGHRLLCQRDLIFGKGQMINIPRDQYPMLKRIFEEVHRRDGVTLSLIQMPASGAAK